MWESLKILISGHPYQFDSGSLLCDSIKPVPLQVHLIYSPNSCGWLSKNHSLLTNAVAPDAASIVLHSSSRLTFSDMAMGSRSLALAAADSLGETSSSSFSVFADEKVREGLVLIGGRGAGWPMPIPWAECSQCTWLAGPGIPLPRMSYGEAGKLDEYTEEVAEGGGREKSRSSACSEVGAKAALAAAEPYG